MTTFRSANPALFRRRRAAAFVGAVGLFAAASTLSLADVRLEPHGKAGLMTITVSGEIKGNDADALKRALQRLKRSGTSLHMNAVRIDSEGGSKVAALEMGRMIRRAGLNTFVGPEDACSSACIYVVMGGVNRMVYGEVKLHRASFRQSVPIDDVRPFVETSARATRRFISEMGGSVLLSEAIFITPPWAVRTLTEEEKRRWAVHGMERGSEEVYFVREAKRRKMTRDQLEDLFVRHLNPCIAAAKRFEATVYDCVAKQGSSSGREQEVALHGGSETEPSEATE